MKHSWILLVTLLISANLYSKWPNYNQKDASEAIKEDLDKTGHCKKDPKNCEEIVALYKKAQAMKRDGWFFSGDKFTKDPELKEMVDDELARYVMYSSAILDKETEKLKKKTDPEEKLKDILKKNSNTTTNQETFSESYIKKEAKKIKEAAEKIERTKERFSDPEYRESFSNRVLKDVLSDTRYTKEEDLHKNPIRQTIAEYIYYLSTSDGNPYTFEEFVERKLDQKIHQILQLRKK